MTRALSLKALKRLAWQDLSRDIRAMRLLILLLFLGTTLIGIVGNLSQSLQEGLKQDARHLLGGDLVVQRAQQTLPIDLTDKIKSFTQRAVSVTQARALKTMLHPISAATKSPLLVSLQAVDTHFPITGRFTPTDLNGQPIPFSFEANDQGYPGLYADPLIADSFALKIGDVLRIGQQNFIFNGEFTTFPGNSVQNFALAPHVLIALSDLQATGLSGYGSLSHSKLSYVFSSDPSLSQLPDLSQLIDHLYKAYPNEGLILRSSQNGPPNLRKLTHRFSLYVSLTGILSLLIGGLGIQHALKTYLSKRQKTIAMLKSIGLTQSHIIYIYVIQLCFCLVFALLPALSLAAVIPILVDQLHITSLPFATGLFILPLLETSGYTFLILFSFALPILYKSKDITAIQAFQSYTIADSQLGWRFFKALSHHEKCQFICLYIPIPCLLLWIFLFRQDYLLTYTILVGCAILWICLAWISRMIQKGAVLLDQKHQQQAKNSFPDKSPNPILRFIMMRLKQPNSVLHSALSALGLGMAGLSMVLLCQQAILSLIDQSLPDQAPSFFVLDLPPTQKDDFTKATKAFDQTKIIAQLPMLRGSITAIKGVPTQKAVIAPDATWAISGDRGISFSADMPEGTEIVEGTWWRPEETKQIYISLDDNLAKGFGMSLGDTLTVSILGRPFTAILHNTRKIVWSNFSMNFAILFTPGPLEKAPYNLLLTVKTPANQDGAFLTNMSAKFPNLTFIPVRQLLQQLNEKLSGLAIALQIAAFVTCLTGFIVLMSALIASQESDRRDLAIFSMLGTSARTLFWAHAFEFLILGSITISCALLFGTAGAWGLISGAFNLPFTPSWLLLSGLIISSTLFLSLSALWIKREDLLSPPTSILRNS